MKESFAPLPLPSYSLFRLVKERPFECSIISAVLTLSVTIVLWKYWHSRFKRSLGGGEGSFHQNSSEDSLSQGCFNFNAIKGLRRYLSPAQLPEAVDLNDQYSALNAFFDYEKIGPIYSMPKNNVESQEDGEEAMLSNSDEDDSEKELEEELEVPSKKQSISEELVENDHVVGSLKTLHGKLATADMNLKARKLEQSMSEEERREEASVRKKQLESIYSLMAADKERFGVNDKSEIIDQMKLYSFYK